MALKLKHACDVKFVTKVLFNKLLIYLIIIKLVWNISLNFSTSSKQNHTSAVYFWTFFFSFIRFGNSARN